LLTLAVTTAAFTVETAIEQDALVVALYPTSG